MVVAVVRGVAIGVFDGGDIAGLGRVRVGVGGSGIATAGQRGGGAREVAVAVVAVGSHHTGGGLVGGLGGEDLAERVVGIGPGVAQGVGLGQDVAGRVVGVGGGVAVGVDDLGGPQGGVAVVVQGGGRRGRPITLGQRGELAVQVVLDGDIAVGVGDGGRTPRGRQVVPAVGEVGGPAGWVDLFGDLPGAVIGIGHFIAGVNPAALAVGVGHGLEQVPRGVGERGHPPAHIGHRGELARAVVAIGHGAPTGAGHQRDQPGPVVGELQAAPGGVGHRRQLARSVRQGRDVAVEVGLGGELA